MNENGHQQQQKEDASKYLRFGAMILTAMVVMYWVMFLSSWELSHIRFSLSRVYMTLVMGGTMGLIMLAWMLHMYHNTKINLVIIFLSILIFGVGVFLDRRQIGVSDGEFMSAMIPHHSLAITRAERAHIEDVRICELAQQISKAQRLEIEEMNWLLEDIRLNGVVRTQQEANSRPIPEFQMEADRECL